MKQRGKQTRIAGIHRAHALWPVDLVGREREQVDRQFGDVHRQFAGSLAGIRVKTDFSLATKVGNGLDRLDDARLVINPLDGDKRGFGGNFLVKPIEVDASIAADRHDDDIDALVLQVRGHFQYGGMFRASGDDAASPRPCPLDRRQQHHVIGFCAAASENNAIRICAQQLRHELPRFAEIIPALDHRRYENSKDCQSRRRELRPSLLELRRAA